MSEELNEPDARSISVHLLYLRKELDDIRKVMATKSDIEELRKDLAGYAKADTVMLLERRVDQLETNVGQNSLGNTAKRFANGVLLAAAVVGVFGGLVGLAIEAVHWYDRVTTGSK